MQTFSLAAEIIPTVNEPPCFLRPADRHAVAVLGTGRMGAAMARSLLRDGFRVTVWNRTRERAEALAADGARVADTPADALRGAQVVITTLSDGEATAGVVGGALDGLRSGAVWIQMATVGVYWTCRLGACADRHGVEFVDAPVSGSDGRAEQGTLLVLASGPDTARERVRPAFEALGRRTLWLGPAGRGTRLKLALVNWQLQLTQAMAESLGLAEALGLDPSLLLDAMVDGPLLAPYATQKGRAMLDSEFLPGFALRDALKDAKLVLDAASCHGAELPQAEATAGRWEQAVNDGYGGQDVAAVVELAWPVDGRSQIADRRSR